MTISIAAVDVKLGCERTLMRRVAVIGDVGGYVRHLRHALGQLGVTDSVWPDDLNVIQVGDLFGGRADVAVAELVGPHLRTGRWTQLIGNWELEAVGGVAIGRAGRTVHRDAVAAFRRWHCDGLVRRAASVTSSTGSVGVVTHAGISRGFWRNDLRSEPDAHRVVEMLNMMRFDDVCRPGSMFGRPDESAPGPIWSSEAETWPDWGEVPVPASSRSHDGMEPDARLVGLPPRGPSGSSEGRPGPCDLHAIARLATDHRRRPRALGPLGRRRSSAVGASEPRASEERPCRRVNRRSRSIRR